MLNLARNQPRDSLCSLVVGQKLVNLGQGLCHSAMAAVPVLNSSLARTKAGIAGMQVQLELEFAGAAITHPNQIAEIPQEEC